MSKSTKQYLDIIADHLWDGHASLFVGAGFSKNAIPKLGAKLPPDWNELGDLFFEKTRHRKPKAKDRAYANVLRLAEEVNCFCGRESLSDLIRESINDANLEPSDLHLQLLSLPWKDVYTTNYDTLLDRAANRLNGRGKRAYSLIFDDQDIGVSSSPFLMKLHGNINAPNSIVITEEDYRKYPSLHKAMINHIQNTIMTETLVLIGFSGNDPNFIQWLGWVKDALSENQRKVYMLTMGAVSESMVKTFEKKNVVIVNLHCFAGKDATVSENIAAAIQYFEEFHRNREEERIRFKKQAMEWGRSFSHNEDIKELYGKWKSERDSYPGWLVLPRDKREFIANTEGFSLPIDKMSQLTNPYDLLFLDLFNWRIEKCLYPIENRWEPVYQSILQKYHPFKGRSRNDVKVAWVNLKLGLLRLYRQEGWGDKWHCLNDELSLLCSRFPDEQRCRFSYEQALMAVYQNDYEWLRKVLDKWQEQKTDPYWNIRRGSLWAEYLSLETGKEITRKAFEEICEKLQASDNDKDRYFWASRKVHAHTVWNCLTMANFSRDESVTYEARSTWNELRPYEDIWYEREFFDAHLRSIEELVMVKTKEPSFRLGRSSTITNIGENSQGYRIAYAFFLYYEEMSFPIHLPYLNTMEKPTLKKALSVMEYCSPAIAECWMMRSGDPKMVAPVFNRRFLNQTNNKDVSALYDRYLKCLDELLEHDKDEETSSWVLVFKNILPEILSRLCMKATYESRLKTFDYIDRLFRDGKTIRYVGLDGLISSLMSSFSKVQIKELIPKLAQMAIANDRCGDCRFEPLFYVHDPVDICESHIASVADTLIGQLGMKDRFDKAIICRLLFLDKCGALTAQQQKRLGEVLWSKRDNTGFPADMIYYRFAFLSFPHPHDVEPKTILKEYFCKCIFPQDDESSTVSLYGGFLPVLNDIKGIIDYREDFIWDAPSINHICSGIIGMWDSEKKRLLEEDNVIGFSVKEEFQGRFSDVATIVSGIIAPNIELLDERNLMNLERMTQEFEDYGMPALQMKAALSDFLQESIDFSWEIYKRLASSNNRVVEDGVNAIIQLFKKGREVIQWVELMSDYFRSNAWQKGTSIIGGLVFFMKKKKFQNSEIISQNLVLGLKRLYDETEIVASESELSANNKMHFRFLVAPMVCCLLANKDNNKYDEFLSRWKSYYESEETCWDIRNRYCDDDTE